MKIRKDSKMEERKQKRALEEARQMKRGKEKGEKGDDLRTGKGDEKKKTAGKETTTNR